MFPLQREEPQEWMDLVSPRLRKLFLWALSAHGLSPAVVHYVALNSDPPVSDVHPLLDSNLGLL